MIMNDAIKNFSEFPALGLVLAVMIGIGAAEKSGYFDKLLSVVNHASKSSSCQQLYLSVLWAVLLVMRRPSFYHP